MLEKILSCALVIFLAAGSAQAAAPKNAAPPAVAVEAARVQSEPVERTIEAVGNLISNESVVLSPEISGRVAEIFFEEGAAVTSGMPLIRLDDSIYKAQLAQANASLILSEANHKRAEELYKQQSGTGRARDEALAKRNSDKAAVDLAEAQLDKATISAPFDGIAGLRQVSVGDYVNPGQPMVNYESIDPLKVDFRIAEVYLAALKPGQEIQVTVDAFPGKVFTGEVYAIDPRVDSAGRAVVLRAKLPNPDKLLRPGLFARVKLVVERKESAIMVDEQALVPQGDQQFIYKIIDGKAVQTPVKTGIRRGGKVEITEGLSTDDTIVTAGQMKLRPNSAVTVLPPATAPASGEGKSQ
ncbi:MAG: efflux RND transporter periplasmic adaptor subunit [Micavibrio aeruginosavorus]|nr:efflux RND transporter periplasmic adaptor subunit [Micavibrio aeruginosavorus]